MLHGEMRQHTTKGAQRPELVVWTSLWGRSLAYVMGEAEQKSRFSYALRRAMDERHVSARSLAKTLGIDARRVTGWLNAKALPNLYESQALAAALKVDEALFKDPPEVPPPPPEPYYPIERYLLDAAAAEGRRRATTHLEQLEPGARAPKPAPRPRSNAAGRG
jgi:transcriptional regulator with XRE-family HTH domain